MKINIKSSVEFSSQEEKENIRDFLDELHTACNQNECNNCSPKDFCDHNISSNSLANFISEFREVINI